MYVDNSITAHDLKPRISPSANASVAISIPLQELFRGFGISFDFDEISESQSIVDSRRLRFGGVVAISGIVIKRRWRLHWNMRARGCVEQIRLSAGYTRPKQWTLKSMCELGTR
jgi:hypothetical protein